MAEKGKDGSAVTESVGELVVSVPSPCRDHRKHQPSTLVEELLIDARVVRTDIGRDVRYIEFNWATAAGLEVDEERPAGCVEDVPRMGLAVKELLGRAAPIDVLTDTPQCVEQKFTPCGVECRCSITVRYKTLRFLHPVSDVRSRYVYVAHSGVKSLERVCIVGGRELIRRPCVVVGPQRDGEAIALVDARFGRGLQGRHGCLSGDELLRELKLERGHFLAHGCDPSEYITRQETQRELVRVLDDSHVPDGQVHGNGNRSHGSHRTRHPSTSTNEFCHSASGKTAAIAVEQRELPSFRRGTSRNNAVSRKLVNRLQADPAVPPGELAETMSHLASGVS